MRASRCEEGMGGRDLNPMGYAWGRWDPCEARKLKLWPHVRIVEVSWCGGPPACGRADRKSAGAFRRFPPFIPRPAVSVHPVRFRAAWRP